MRTRAKVAALRSLCSYSATLGQFEAFGSHHQDRTPIIKGPLDPEPGFDQVRRLVWQAAV
jgi:hypothetical protein